MAVSRAVFRTGCGSADSDSNAADFRVGFPSPRNTATAPNLGLSGAGLAFPYLVETGLTTRLTVSVLQCADAQPLSGAAASVLADLSSLGQASAVAMLDDGLGADEFAGDGIYTLSVNLSGATLGAKHVPISYSSAGNSGGSFIALQVKAAATPNNDNCSTAEFIPGAPYTTPVDQPFNLSGASVESNSIQALGGGPTTGMGARRGVWFSVLGSGTTMSASLCASATDTVMLVMGGRCDGLSVVASGDDNGPACSGSAASASWCSIAGETYWVWIATFATSAPNLASSLRISADNSACNNAIPVGACAPNERRKP
jgi:hypothetical protein